MLSALGPRRIILDKVTAAAGEQGVQACLVGGAVIDLLERRPVKDLDVVVVGDAPALAHTLADRHGGQVRVHPAFRTATWTHPDGEPVDLVTARRETYAGPAALPVITPGTLDDDLARRDFTVLTLAVDLATGALIDPGHARRDLAARLLRVQHPDSFIDDPTRVWRGARWATRLELQAELGTRRAMDQALHTGAHEALGLERLGHELDRLLQEPKPWLVTQQLLQWGWLQTLYPGLDAELSNRLRSVGLGDLRAHEAAGGIPADRLDTLWLTLAQQIPTTDRGAMERLVTTGGGRLTLWREGPERVAAARTQLKQDLSPAAIGRVLSELTRPERVLLHGFGGPTGEEALAWWEREGRLLTTVVTAADLLAQGISQGPAVGLGLAAAQDAAWAGGDPAAQLRAALAAAT